MAREPDVLRGRILSGLRQREKNVAHLLKEATFSCDWPLASHTFADACGRIAEEEPSALVSPNSSACLADEEDVSRCREVQCSTRSAHVIRHPCYAAPAGHAGAARGGGAVLLVYLAAPPSLPAQTAVSTCRYGDGSCQPSRQCR